MHIRLPVQGFNFSFLLQFLCFGLFNKQSSIHVFRLLCFYWLIYSIENWDLIGKKDIFMQNIHKNWRCEDRCDKKWRLYKNKIDFSHKNEYHFFSSFSASQKVVWMWVHWMSIPDWINLKLKISKFSILIQPRQVITSIN